MNTAKISETIDELFIDSKNDYLRMVTGLAKGVFRPLKPSDFKDAYLSISREQGEYLRNLIRTKNIKNIIEFGTSFGISTLYLAHGVMHTGGNVITTELLESKAEQAIKNFKKAGVNEYIDLRVGDAMVTLDGHQAPIDLLILDGWKNLYLPLFRMLESNFHSETIIYVDNADMHEVQSFLNKISTNSNYRFDWKHNDKVVVISIE